MIPHPARALWFSGGLEEGDSGAELRGRAREERERIEDREWEDKDTDEGFMRLVG